MKQALLVGLGGAIGSIARYLLGASLLHRFPHLKFPLGTFTVNFLGCLLIGLIAGYAERRENFSPDIRLFLMTGLCGGFTTFSAFAHENLNLLRRGDSSLAFAYIAASVLLGLAATWLGAKCVSTL